MGTQRKTFDALIKFRASGDMANRLKAIAERKEKQLPEIEREAIKVYCDAEEKRLGIKRNGHKQAA